MSLATIWDTRTVTLSLVLRVDDHFTGVSVPTALDVRLEDRPELPIVGPSGSRRQPDGTYRFVNLPDGNYTVTVADPHLAWEVDGSPLLVTLPLPDVLEVQVLEARRTPAAGDVVGQTTLRIRVDASGLPVAQVPVAVDDPSGTFAFNAITDGDGEAVHPIVTSILPANDGTLNVEVRVDGGASTVLQVTADGVTTAGSLFDVHPGRATRVFVEVTP